MAVTGVNAPGWSYAATANGQGAAGANRVDKLAFLRLIVAQLRNQNPLDPIDNAQFLTQLAQFDALEQMQLSNERLASLLQSQIKSGDELSRAGATLQEMLAVLRQMLAYQQGRTAASAVP